MDTHDLHALGESTLLKRLVDGEVKALERLYDRHAGALYALALRIAASPERAESAVEATFSDLWSARDRLEASGASIPPALWLMTRCRAHALDHARRQETSGSPPWPVEPVRSPATRLKHLLALDPTARSAHVRERMAALPEAQRAAVEKAYFEGASVSRIAAELGRAPRDVARDLKEALAALAASLENVERGSSAE